MITNVQTRRSTTTFEATGEFCSTPNGNFLNAAASCNRTTRPGTITSPTLKSSQGCVANLQGSALREAELVDFWIEIAVFRNE